MIKKLLRKFNKCFWWNTSLDGTPMDIVKRLRKYKTEDLIKLRGKEHENPSSGTPRAFQIKAIEREIRKRGI